VVSNTTIKNTRNGGRKKFITRLCCHVGRNNRDLIRNIVTGLVVKELTMFDTAQEYNQFVETTLLSLN